MKTALLLAKDPWFVIAAVLAVTSGGATFSGRVAAAKSPAGTAAASAPSQTSAASGAAPVFPAASVPPAFPSGQAPSAGAGPSIQGPGFSRILQPKTPGRWIVDSAKAKDSDTDSLAEAVSNAAEGDTILLRPGTYKGGLKLEKSISILGQPGKGDPPVIAAGDAHVVEVRLGDARLEDLVIRQTLPSSAGRFYSGIYGRGGALTLRRVRVESEGARGLDNAGSKTTAEASSFKATDYAISHSRGSLACAGCVIFDSGRSGLWIGADAAETRVVDSKIYGNGSGGGVSAGGPVVLERVHIYRNRGSGVWVSGSILGEVKLVDCQVSENAGPGLMMGGKAVLEKVRTFHNNEQGLRASGSGLVRLTDFKAVENGREGLEANGGAKIEVDGCEVTGNRDDGIGGFSGAELDLKRCRVRGNTGVGLRLVSGGRGRVEDCDFTGNGKEAYYVNSDSSLEGKRVSPPLPGGPK